jgi:hypothetical protein
LCFGMKVHFCQYLCGFVIPSHILSLRDVSFKKVSFWTKIEAAGSQNGSQNEVGGIKFETL